MSSSPVGSGPAEPTTTPCDDLGYDTQLRNGERLARSGQLDQAESAFRQGLDCRPGAPSAASPLARVLLALQRRDEALALLDDALRTGAGQWHPDLLLRAQTVLDANAMSDAVAAFRTAVDVAPANSAAELGLAMALGESGPIRAAHATARRAPELFVRPEPGLLTLFPSWMWHGTVPFSGQPQDRRLTIVFDVAPA